MATKNRGSEGQNGSRAGRASTKELDAVGDNGAAGQGQSGAKGKGFLTYDEVSDNSTGIPQDPGVDQIDDVMGVIGDEDIEIVDAATQVKIAPKRIVEEEAAEKKQV